MFRFFYCIYPSEKSTLNYSDRFWILPKVFTVFQYGMRHIIIYVICWLVGIRLIFNWISHFAKQNHHVFHTNTRTIFTMPYFSSLSVHIKRFIYTSNFFSVNQKCNCVRYFPTSEWENNENKKRRSITVSIIIEEDTPCHIEYFHGTKSHRFDHESWTINKHQKWFFFRFNVYQVLPIQYLVLAFFNTVNAVDFNAPCKVIALIIVLLILSIFYTNKKKFNA